MIRRTCYEKIGLFDPLLMQLPDFDIWIRLCMHFEIYILSEELTAFRILGRGRNVSAPSEAAVAREAWELHTILQHYSKLDKETVRNIFHDLPTIIEMESPALALALEAIRIGRPGYRQYGLELIRECLIEKPNTLPYKQYFRLVGESDPYATRFAGKLSEYTVKSTIFKILQHLARKIRAQYNGL